LRDTTLRRRQILGAGLASLAAFGPLRARSQQLRRITIGANPAGTNFNVIAGGFAKLLQETLRVPSIVRPYSGSSVYIPLLERGEITLGINSGIDSYLSFHGEAPYPSAMTRIRALLAVYPLGYMYWVKADSSLRRIEDLAGQRVVINYRGLFVLDRLNRALLATGGLDERDVSARTAAGLPEGARMVLEGRADAVAMGYRLPLVKQMHASIPGGLRFLEMGADPSRVTALMPGTRIATVSPAPSDVGIERPLRVAEYDTFLNGGTHLPNDEAYRIVASLHGNWRALQRDYTLLAAVEPDATVPSDQPHPYHDGAIEYFRDTGIWTPAHEANQRKLLAAPV
jgi:uncharacterized protein